MISVSSLLAYLKENRIDKHLEQIEASLLSCRIITSTKSMRTFFQ